jgi:hypothetical protein
MNPAFNGDSFIERELRRLVQKWSIKTIVETGTYHGATTRALATFGPDVVTIEMDWERFESGNDLDEIRNIRRLHGDSPILRLCYRIIQPDLPSGCSLGGAFADRRARSYFARLYSCSDCTTIFNPIHPNSFV